MLILYNFAQTSYSIDRIIVLQTHLDSKNNVKRHYFNRIKLSESNYLGILDTTNRCLPAENASLFQKVVLHMAWKVQ